MPTLFESASKALFDDDEVLSSESFRTFGRRGSANTGLNLRSHCSNAVAA